MMNTQPFRIYGIQEKTALSGKSIAMQACIKKLEKNQVNNISYLKELEKDKNNSKADR